MYPLVIAGRNLLQALALALLLIGLPAAGHAQPEAVSEWKPFSMQTRLPDSLATLALQGSYRVFHAGTAFTKVEVRLEKGTVDVVPEKKSEIEIQKLHVHLRIPNTSQGAGGDAIIPNLAFGEPTTYQLRKTTPAHYDVTGPSRTIVLPANVPVLDKAFLYAVAWISKEKGYFPALSSPLDSWTRHRAPAGGYTVEFPGPPETGERPRKLPVGLVVGHQAAFTASDRRAFLAEYSDYPPMTDPQSFLDEQLGLSVIAGYKLRNSQRIEIDGVPARRFVADSPTSTMIGFLALRDRRRYYVAAAVPLHEDSAPDVQRFLKSFALASPAAAQAPKPGWIADPKSGCKFWDEDPRAGEKISWSGPCVGGVVEGRGTLEISVNGTFDQRGEGEFKGGRANGQIVLLFADGARGEGPMHDSKRWGHWTETMAGGDRFEGEYRNDLREGHGVYVWADGRRYEGEYSNDRPHGAGTLVRYGETYSGVWTNGCFKQGNRTAWIVATGKECGFE
jgi:hypothetical protein